MASIESYFNGHPTRNFWGNIISMVVIAILAIIGVYLSLIFYTHHGNTVVVPNVIGKDYKEAKEILKQAGLRVEVADTGYMTQYPGNLILDQQIPAGSIVKFNRPVFLTINADHPRRIALPSVIDGSARLAEMKLKGMGFKVGTPKRIPGDNDLVMGIEVNGVPVTEGTHISVEDAIVLVVGNGEVDEKYNGNDSLDWVFQIQIQDEERKSELEAQSIRDRLKAKKSEDASAHDEDENANAAPVAPNEKFVPVTISSKDLLD